MDDYLMASSSTPTRIRLCGDRDSDAMKTADCRKAGYDTLITQIDASFDKAVARMPVLIKPLFKRDQVWFNEVIIDAAETVVQSDEQEQRDLLSQTLRTRLARLNGIAEGFGRTGLAGSWANAFGAITLTPTEDGAYRVTADLFAKYHFGSRGCRFAAVVKPTSTDWLTGDVLAEKTVETKSGDKSEPPKPPSIKLRRQGETLRIVGVEGSEGWDALNDCDTMWQITGSYFASGKSDANDKANNVFVAPTFDCSKPESATDEEICADPDLADNDRRLNRAWKALQPRLDETTRRALADDQRNWVKSQTEQYPEFLHPAWEKQTSQAHSTTDARDHLDGLQRERSALLEGFDDKRVGLVGIWLAHNAILKVTQDADGTLKAVGWKWDQGDWKAGCDYDMTGKLVGGAFRSDEERKNPDTLERDHTMLIVNRQDDVFAKKRYSKKDFTENKDADEQKCKRRLDVSSTARLFPAKPSPDIDNFKGSIR
jgi:uncharacterized protein YecT (DUF1311 family)